MAGAERRPRLWDELSEAYDTYDHLCFMAKPPKEPRSEYRRKQAERTARIVLGMPLVPVWLLRLRDFFLRREVPVLPYACELLSTAGWGVSIGRHVQIGPGLVLPHGQVIADGAVTIGRDCVINPWAIIGLSASRRYGFDGRGPAIGDGVYIGAGAKLLGPITVGDGARIGANAVVIDDVPAGATVVGAPARVIRTEQPDWELVAQLKAAQQRPDGAPSRSES
jgi:serine O-acetyltransferase